MLNALRHQRYKQMGVVKIWVVHVVCSTPYGIKGINRTLGARDLPGLLVLNALRHQRYKQWPNGAPVATEYYGAQRLTASKV